MALHWYGSFVADEDEEISRRTEEIERIFEGLDVARRSNDHGSLTGIGPLFQRVDQLRREINTLQAKADITGENAKSTAIWIVVAATSGVVGNAAYDALASVVAKARTRPRATPLAMAEAVLVARLTMCVRLRQVVSWTLDPDVIVVRRAMLLPSGIWDFRLEANGVIAYISVPPGDPQVTPAKIHLQLVEPKD